MNMPDTKSKKKKKKKLKSVWFTTEHTVNQRPLNDYSI